MDALSSSPEPSADRTSDSFLLPWWTFPTILVTVFLVAVLSHYPGEIHHDTSEIFMWSRLGWPLALPKHPPLMPWLFRIWFGVFPVSAPFVMLLSALNITAGAYFVWRIAHLELDRPRATAALLLYATLPFVSIMAIKLNHNAILVSLWPLATLAFLTALRRPTMLAGVGLGLAAAATMLAKYYSALLLLAFVVAAIATPRGRAAFARPAPYVAVAVCLVALAPHLWAAHLEGDLAIGYALHNEGFARHGAADFLVSNLLLLVPIAAAFILAAGRGLKFKDNWSAAVAAGRVRPELAIITFLPPLVTALAIFIHSLKGSTTWALPTWSVLPVLLASAIERPDAGRLKRGAQAELIALLAVVVLSPLVLYASFADRTEEAVEPHEIASAKAEQLWDSISKSPLKYSGGDLGLEDDLSFRARSHPLAWTDLDLKSAPWISPRELRTKGAVMVCRDEVRYCGKLIADMIGAPLQLECALRERRRLMGLVGPAYRYRVTVIPPGGRLDDTAPFVATCVKLGGEARIFSSNP